MENENNQTIMDPYLLIVEPFNNINEELIYMDDTFLTSSKELENIDDEFSINEFLIDSKDTNLFDIFIIDNDNKESKQIVNNYKNFDDINYYSSNKNNSLTDTQSIDCII